MIYLVCILECFINALIDAGKIKRNKKPNHEANAGIYLAVVVLCCFVTSVWAALPLICLRPLVFDSLLNAFRNLPIMYQSSVTGSRIDRLENRIFGKYAWEASTAIYFSGFVIGLAIQQKWVTF